MQTIAIHRTFEKTIEGRPEETLYVCQHNSVESYTGKELLKFLESIQPETVVRFTAVNAADALLSLLAEKGIVIVYAPWHSTGIEKNLPPEEIVAKYSALPNGLFRVFTVRRDIAELRRVLNTRNAVQGYYNDRVRCLKQEGRNLGITAPENDVLLQEALESLDIISSMPVLKAKDGDKTVSWDKKVEKVAKTIPECVLFNEIAGISTSWIMAASVVAYSGGIERFPTVASFWHYMGQHVVDGKMPKRTKGQPQTWSTKGRTVLYQLGESLIKNRNNPWRTFFEEEKAAEIAMHQEKHPGCKAVQGHSHARARRKMVKEIIKRFYLAAQGVPYAQGAAIGK